MKGLATLMVVLAVVQLMVEPSQALNCEQVDQALAPCIPYLTGDRVPSSSCCTGVRNIRQMALKPSDKQTACTCVKNAANRYPNLKDDAANALPAECGVDIDIPISRTTNCDAIAQSVTCDEVDSALAPCIPFLTGGAIPSSSCCSGVRNIKRMASNEYDEKTACNCVKVAANRYSNLKDDAAKALPDICGVQMDVPISRTTNCDAI